MKVIDENTILATRGRKRARKALSEVHNRRKASIIEKIEEDAFSDVRMVAEYVPSILAAYQEEEDVFKPVPNYMNFQGDLRWAMRTVLVDWIIDVHYKLHLLPETLYLAVNLIDRFLSVRVVSIGKLQLVGVSGLLVASKYEEVASPSVETFVVLTDRSFTENDILRAEKYLLHCLEYRIGCPSPLNWLRRCTQNTVAETLAVVILDLTLLSEHFLKYSPSVTGAAVSYAARCLTQAPDNEVFHHYSPHSIQDLSECILAVKEYLAKPIVHVAVFKKHGASFTKTLDKLDLIKVPECPR
ncbi:G2/mitotic-specific cyclin 1/2 [Nematocida displodere]|uniref:G2/mitotic-specific cyclin 1/2 n=1 Tax=Nematocida displodere TaxID=1805483 RepID=A0A177EDY2_9MICR|nr:G2/mitotic-specific cyclin 1/2 [Nematocida displodere]